VSHFCLFFLGFRDLFGLCFPEVLYRLLRLFVGAVATTISEDTAVAGKGRVILPGTF